MGCCNCDPNFCCWKPKKAIIPKELVVVDNSKCARKLVSPETNSLLLYDAEGRIVWRDGSNENPISLPEMQTLPIGSVLTHIVGLADGHLMVKIPITEEPIEMCDGTEVTALATQVVPP